MRCPIKLELELKNNEIPLAKPSIEKPPTLKLEALPSHLYYVFLGPNNILPMIIAVDLNKVHVDALTSIQKGHWVDYILWI